MFVIGVLTPPLGKDSVGLKRLHITHTYYNQDIHTFTPGKYYAAYNLLHNLYYIFFSWKTSGTVLCNPV